MAMWDELGLRDEVNSLEENVCQTKAPHFSTSTVGPTCYTRFELHKADHMLEDTWIPCSAEGTSETKQNTPQPCDCVCVCVCVCKWERERAWLWTGVD